MWLAIALLRGILGEPDAAIRLVVTMAAEGVIVNLGIKSLFRRARPVHNEVRPHRMRTPRTTSFPSGHATSSFTAAVVLADGLPLLAAPPLFALAVIVALSRIHVRIHHASDVIGGAMLGLLAGTAVRAFFPVSESP